MVRLGLAELAFPINDRSVKGKKIDWIKWAIWAPWIALIAWVAIAAGGYHSVNFLLDTVNGISVAGDAERPALYAYVIYYLVVGLFLALPLLVGKRAACHTVCWMAPFMILGRKLRNLVAWPTLRLQADPARLQRLPDLFDALPDEPGRERDGQTERHGKRRVHSVRVVPGWLRQEGDPLQLQRREIKQKD